MSHYPTETEPRRTHRVLVAHRQALLSLALVTLRYSAHNDAIERASRREEVPS